MRTVQVRLKPYIQPFERVLAGAELAGLCGASPSPDDAEGLVFTLEANVSADELAGRLAYFESVRDARWLPTLQAFREATVSTVRNGIAFTEIRRRLPLGDEVPLVSRRVLRYGPHGIHEYRGKFFPQLVRALINASGVRPGSTVADPMMGSGTAIVESVLAGNKAWGLDINPLSVLVSRTKVEVLSLDPETLGETYEFIRGQVHSDVRPRSCGTRWSMNLPKRDQEYLASWFSPEALASLDVIMQAINRIEVPALHHLGMVSLSNILRRVSWQKDDDLRVRKEIRLDIDIDPQKEFLEEFSRSVKTIMAFLLQEREISIPNWAADEGDARQASRLWGEETVDLIITSPPYATALPYLDTDRLSLTYLGLIPRAEFRARERDMIGNREVSAGLRDAYLARLEREGDQIPQSVRDVIGTIQRSNEGVEVGFRRRNLPALLASYFFDMRDVIRECYRALKPGATAFFVVGNNHTVSRGLRIDILTTRLLEDVARVEGFEVGEPLSMEMLASRDIFRRNAVASEEVLTFRKPIL